MLYTIHKMLAFRPDDGALWLLTDETCKTVITPTASRLLNMLIDHQGSVQLREEILERVWDAYGLEASNNSLNQNISLIRRTLISFGVPENAIKTIPKFGFLFNADIEIEQCDKIDVNQSLKQQEIKTSFFSWLIISVTFLFSIIIGLYFLSVSFSNNVEKFEPFSIGDIEGCPVYSLDKYNAYTEKKWLEKAKAVFSKSDSQCDQDSVLYFFADDKVMHKGKGTVYLAVCTQHEGQIMSCNNIIFHDWKEI